MRGRRAFLSVTNPRVQLLQKLGRYSVRKYFRSTIYCFIAIILIILIIIIFVPPTPSEEKEDTKRKRRRMKTKLKLKQKKKETTKQTTKLYSTAWFRGCATSNKLSTELIGGTAFHLPKGKRMTSVFLLNNKSHSTAADSRATCTNSTRIVVFAFASSLFFKDLSRVIARIRRLL